MMACFLSRDLLFSAIHNNSVQVQQMSSVLVTFVVEGVFSLRHHPLQNDLRFLVSSRLVVIEGF